jgi:hypothetical protein
MGKFTNLGRTVASALAAIIISTACIGAAVGPAATGAPQIASVQGQAQQA